MGAGPRASGQTAGPGNRDVERIELRFKMGDILHRRLEELDRAILEYERVIQDDPAHEAP